MTMSCIHCDKPFLHSYLAWHAARALKREDKTSTLRCKRCFNMTPLRFSLLNPPKYRDGSRILEATR